MTRTATRKSRQLQSEGLADTFDDGTIKEQWNALTEEERSQYDTLAKLHRERGPNLTAEIQDVLDRTNKKVSWAQLEAQLSSNCLSIVSKTSLRRFVMNQRQPKAKK